MERPTEFEPLEEFENGKRTRLMPLELRERTLYRFRSLPPPEKRSIGFQERHAMLVNPVLRHGDCYQVRLVVKKGDGGTACAGLVFNREGYSIVRNVDQYWRGFPNEIEMGYLVAAGDADGPDRELEASVAMVRQAEPGLS